MRKFRLTGLALVVLFLLMCSTNVFAAYDGTSTDVMLQGFHWESHQYGWWNIVNQNAAAIQAARFNVVWLPPCSTAGSDEGYLPTQWYNLSSNYGNQSGLQTAISTLHGKGIKVLADIVVNHRNGTSNWADFSNPSFANNNQAVCNNDEWGQGTGAADTGEGYSAARDLDHTYSSVQTEIKNWMGWLKNTIGFDGWRYDFVKGFSGSYVGSYNDATTPYFSVGEFWPTNYFDAANPDNWRQQIINWVNATGSKSAAFDFVTKPLLAQAFNNNEYYRLKDSSNKPAGTIGWWPAKSVTFLDNHDTGPSPGGGQNHWVFPSTNVAAGYAYILTHPGIPCVYWPHYFDWGTDLQNQIKTMISIRKAQGITSTSTVSIQVADSSKYAAIIDSKVAVKIGPGNWSPTGSWVLAASGTNYAIWTAGTITVPATPTNVTADADSASAITVNWTASTGATSYTIYRSSSATGTYTSVGTSTTTSFTNTGLTASTTYYYKVAASNSAGTSAQSAYASATTSTGGTATTTIKVNYNCGYGNSITIRGSVSPLSWTLGEAATWTTGNVWTYTTTSIPSGTAFEFKALINDTTWSDGANYTGTGGSTITITPTFTGNFYDVMDTMTNWTVSGYTGTGSWHINNYMARAYSCTSESVLTLVPSLRKLGTVTLAYKYQVTGLDSGEYLAVDVYNGSTWTQVASYTGTIAATNASINVTNYASTNFKVRFRTKMSDATEYSYVDNVSITSSLP